MLQKVAIIYNEPLPGCYKDAGEEKAVLGVLDEVEAVHSALEKLGYSVERVPLLPPLESAGEKLKSLQVDLVFNLFEGFSGSPESEAAIADILSKLGKVYTGCPARVLSEALDKAGVKATLQRDGIGTPRYQLLSPETVSEFHLGYPCIVKPCREDASHGLSEESVVNDFTALEQQVARVTKRFGGKAIVEEFVEGREFNATVLGTSPPTVLPISEIVYSMPPGMPKVLTFSAKWEPESAYFQYTSVVCPAEVEPRAHKLITDTAVSVFQLLNCSGYARVDLRLDAHGNPKVLEMNPNPDISPGSGAARQAEASGMTYAQFVETIIRLAVERPR